MSELYNFFVAYWPQIVALISALHILLGAVNAFIPPEKSPAWFRFIIDRLGALPQKGMKGKLGWYSPPGFGSQNAIMKSKKRKKK